MNKRDPKLARWAGLLCIVVLLLLAGCRNRARLATEATEPPAALATVELIATPEPIETTPPQPIAQDAGGAVADLGPFVNWFALASVLLLFLGIAGGAVYVFASGVGGVIVRRNSHLFTRGNHK